MLEQLIPALRATVVLGVLTGLVFPLLMTALCQLLLPYEANGSLVRHKDGHIIGSTLIGQQFASPQYFHGRPSAAGSGYSGEASAGSNLGPTSARLIVGQQDNPTTAGVDESFAGVKQLADAYRKENLLSAQDRVPVDAVTRSGSGLDPHISPENAMLQARRVASARALPLREVAALVEQHTQGRQLGFLGEPRVNVLELNLALDEIKR